MKPVTPNWARFVALIAALAVVSSCGLPRVGPNKREIFAGSVQRQGDAFIVTVNDRVTRATSFVPALGFSESFKNAGILGSDTIRAGDTLGLTIWENVDDPLLGSSGPAGGAGAAVLEEVQVDGSGSIFIPYAGRIKAAGNTPEAIRRIITRKLGEQTPDPQVQVRRLAGDGASVSLVGAVGGQGVFPIERPTRTLSTMLANAGGIAIEPEIAQITRSSAAISAPRSGSRTSTNIPNSTSPCATATVSSSKRTPAPSRPLAQPDRRLVCALRARRSVQSKRSPKWADFRFPRPIRQASSSCATSRPRSPTT